jgi:phosphate transport system protein
MRLGSSFHDELVTLERRALGGLDLVATQLDRALESLATQTPELAELVLVEDDRIDGLYLELQQGLLSLIARHAPVAEDLRVIAAILHVIRAVERMGDQCVNIAKLVPLSGYEALKDAEIVDMVDNMGRLATTQLLTAKEVFLARDTRGAHDVVRQDQEINTINREIFRRALDVVGDPDKREWAMFMILVGRFLERVGDNAVDIAEQTAFVVTGLFHEFSEAMSHARPGPQRPAAEAGPGGS